MVLYEGVEEPYIDLEQGRLRGVVLDNIIADRYGLSRPTLRAAGDVGRGRLRHRRPPDGRVVAAGRRRRARRDAARRRAARHPDALEPVGRAAAAVHGIAADAAVASGAGSAGGFTATQLALFLRGAGFTVLISTLAMLLAVGGGLVLSVSRRYGGAWLRAAAGAYVEVFRGTPVLLQLYVLYYGLAPVLTLQPLTAAILGLGMNYAAYEAELYRAGMQAVPIGQTEAALSLGMSRAVSLRRIVLPQALRIALPGIANDFIALLKDSSLVSVITVVELTKQMTITAVDVRGWLVPGLLCAALYLGDELSAVAAGAPARAAAVAGPRVRRWTRVSR